MFLLFKVYLRHSKQPLINNRLMFEDEKEIDPKELRIYKKGAEIYNVIDQICHTLSKMTNFL